MATKAAPSAPTTPKDLLARVRGEQARRSLHEFVRQAWPYVETTPFNDSWHIGAICEHLQAVTAGEVRNLLINVPPRSGKSTIVSVMWPMWEWATNPAVRWMCGSYALSLAIRDSVKARRLVESNWYQAAYGADVQLAGDVNQKSRFENTAGGHRLVVSVGSGVTGEGGDVLVIDDPHNAVEITSAAKRTAVLEWWDQAISSRLNDPKTGAKVLIMQRLHAMDLAGHVLEQGGYTHLNIPMEYEAATPCVTPIGGGWTDPRTEEGALLWPDRIGPPEVASLKRQMGSYGYAGQYQQRPVPKEGGTFQLAWMANRYRLLPRLEVGTIVQAVDSAFKTGVGSDWSVITTWATDGVKFYLLDVWRRRVEYPDLVRAIKDQAAKWSSTQPLYRPRAILIEDAASGQSAIQELRRTTNLPILAVPAIGSKESRADAVSPLFEAGTVLLPDEAPWLADYIAELTGFPFGAHDDQVDSTAMGLAKLASYAPSSTVSMAQLAEAGAGNAPGGFGRLTAGESSYFAQVMKAQNRRRP